MKLRLQPGRLNMRLDEDEVQKLAAGEAIEVSVCLNERQRLCYSLEVGDLACLECDLQGTGVVVRVPVAAVVAWAQGREAELQVSSSCSGTQFTVERDLDRRKRVRRGAKEHGDRAANLTTL
jgi:hypothetical protein